MSTTHRQPQTLGHGLAELSPMRKVGLVLLCIGYLVFLGFYMYLDTTHSPASKLCDAMWKTLVVCILLIPTRKHAGDVTTSRVSRAFVVLGITWVAAMVISMVIYAVNLVTKDEEDSHPPDFLMDKVNDWLFPLVAMSSFPVALHYHKGGLKRNWRCIPVYVLFFIWLVAETLSWVFFAVERASVRAVSLWVGIATTVLGTPLLAGSVIWCLSSLKRYDASMELAPAEGDARDDERSTPKCDEVENEARSPLLPRGTGGHVEEP